MDVGRAEDGRTIEVAARGGWWVARAAACAALVFAAPLQAQSSPGYLFGEPRASVTLRGGYSHAQAGSDLFTDLTRDLTLSKSDFNGVSVGGELAVRLAPQTDLTFDISYAGTSTLSHYRDLIDTDDREIEQTTSLQRLPMTVNARVYLTPRGRSIGRFAWIPNRVTPWVGAGAGLMWYRFRQDGDFVDDNTSAVFGDTFVSDGWTGMAQAMAGLDVSLTPRFALTGDARYLMTKDPKLGADFLGYQPLDLSGVVVSLGLTVRL